MDLTGHQATQYPCFGSPEGRFPDPLTSLRFELDGGRLWFKTTPQGVPTGWVVIAGSGGSAPTWAAVLANGSTSGPNSPSIDDGQALLFGDVALFRSSPGNLGISGNVIPIGVRSIGSNTARWLQGFIDHLYVQYASPPSGTLLSTETYVDVIAGNYDLPLASTEGSLFFIRNAGPGATTVAPTGADTINGVASLNVAAGTLVMLVSDGGTNWVATVISGGGSGAVTLQAALDGQNALGVPTTQAYTTRIQIGDGNSWQFEDQAANDVLVIAGDNSPAAIAMTGGNAVGGAGQRITATGGAATVAAQAGGAIALTGGAGNTTGSGGDISFLPGASPAGRPGLEFSLGAIARNAPLPVVLPAGTTSDLAVAGLHSANVLLITPTAPGSALGGIEFLAGQDGRVLQIQNVSTTVSLTILNEDLGSAAANRFVLPAGTSLVVAPGGGLEIWHDGTSVRWRSSTDSGASAAAVTLQAALDGQNALGIPTTQGYVTRIQYNDGFGWDIEDQAANDIVVIRGDGVPTAFSVQGGNTAAGAGQVVSIAAGNATVAAQNGGALSIGSGVGNTTGTGGLLSVIAGAGGATGVGGTLLMRGGPGGATSGNAGGVTVTGGIPIDGNGGTAVLAGTAGVGTNRDGGSVIISSGAATGSGTGGNLSVTAGAGGATGTAGSLAITGGAAGTVSGASGAIAITTQPSVSGATGSITLTTGNATGGVAGDVVLRAGSSAVTNGRVLVQPVWAGDEEAIAIVGNGANGATSGLHAGSRDPNGAVTGHRGGLYMRNPGGVLAGSAFVNVSITDTGTIWSQIATTSAVTLQLAITNQSTTPTTQGFTTRIQFADTFGWDFEDAAGNDIVSIAGDGGATAFAVTGGNTIAGGVGQAISLTGGTATTAAQNGGTVSITGGTGNTTGTGGNLLFLAGPGGATGQGGQAVLQGGAGGATSGNGGAALVQGGLPIDGNGGAVTIAGRNAVTTTAANRNGGAVTVQGGLATLAGTGGNVAVLAGGGGATGTAGSLALTGGAAGTVSGASGPVQIQSQPSVDGNTGSITLTTGNASGAARAAGDIVLRGGTGTGTNGRAIVQPVWTGDGQAFAIVGNGASSATAGLHTSSRVGGPNGAVSSNPGSLLMWNPGVASPGTAYVNVSLTDPGTSWAELINANTAVLAGLPGNIYENLVGYIDSADRNSYPGSGTSVIDIFRNLTAGTLTSSTFDDGGWTWAGTTGALTFVKNANIDNIFAGGGTVIAFIRPNTAGENNFGRVVDTTASGDAGWFLSVSAGASSRLGLTFQRNFNAGVADAGQWQANTVTDPWSGTAVFPVQAGSWSSVAVTYDDGNVANDPIFYVNGALVGTTEVNTPVGTAITDVGNGLLVANRTADDRTFNGSISIVLLFDRILSLSEVTDVYNLFGRRYALGMTGFPATAGMSQDISIVGGPTATATVRSGNVLISGGESSAAGSTSNGGDVTVRGGNITGVNNGRSGNLICLAGSATNSASSATAGTAEFGAGVHNNGNAAGLCTIHGGDNSNQGAGGNMILRGGDCITATGTNDGGGSAGIRAGNGRTAGSTPGSTFIAGGGFSSGTAGTTGNITLSTTRNTLGPFPATGGTSTSTGSISILTTGPGATATNTGNITIQCGDTNAVTGNDPGDILLQAGASASTTQSGITAGSISLVAGANAGVGASVGGGISLTAGASTNTGATTGTGGDITFTGGAMAHNSAASRGGNIVGTAGAATGTNGSGGSVSFTAGAATGTGTAGSASLTAGSSAASAGGTASLQGGAGGGANTGGPANVTAGQGGATGNGGTATISAGAGGATSGNGGTAILQGGSATEGNGGGVTITGRNGVTATAANRNGGTVQISAGDATVAGTAGNVTILAGSGGTTGTAGTVNITGGAGGSTSGTGGQVNISGGTPTDGVGGAVVITGANGVGTNRAGGAVRMVAGNGIGTGIGGGAAATAGNGGATGNGGDVALTSGNGGGTSGNSGNIVANTGTVTSGTVGEFRYAQGSGTRTAATSYRFDRTQTFQTTTTTPFVVTIHTLTSDGRNVGFRFKIRGQQGTTTNFIAATFEQSASRSGGTVTINALESGSVQSAPPGVATIVISASGNDIIATITPGAAVTINWSCYWDGQEGGN